MDLLPLHEIIIGGILSEPSRLEDALKIGISEKIFIKPQLSRLFNTFIILKNEGISPDLLAVSSKLPNDLDIIMALLEKAPIAANYDWYCVQAVQAYRACHFALRLSQLAQSILSHDPYKNFDFVFSEAKKLLDLLQAESSSSTETKTLPVVLSSVIDRIERRILEAQENKPRGIGTGLKKLDSYIGGLVDGRFYLVAARTSVGKTSFAVHLMLSVMKQGKQSVFYTNEMDSEDLLEKALASESQIGSYELQNGLLNQLDRDSFMSTVRKFASFKSGFNESYGRKLERFEAECFRLKKEQRLDVIFLDYTQQMYPESSQFENRHQSLSKVSDSLKRIARDLKVPVVGLAQINRETEKGGKSLMPGLAQLKDSGALEQDADVVMILHKEKIDESKMILNLAKNRHGRTGAIELFHEMRINKFSEM